MSQEFTHVDAQSRGVVRLVAVFALDVNVVVDRRHRRSVYRDELGLHEVLDVPTGEVKTRQRGCEAYILRTLALLLYCYGKEAVL